MLVSQLTEAMLTPDLIDRLLFDGLQDAGQSADCALVLGSINAASSRIPTAARAYHDGRTKLLVMCGGAVHPANSPLPEALLMRDAALCLGVPDTAIVTETTSQNTVENVLCGMVAMQQRLWLNNVHHVLLITASFHMRRSLCIARYLLPSHIEVLPCPADDGHTRRDTWMNSNRGIQRVKTEALNLSLYARNGVFPDFEI